MTCITICRFRNCLRNMHFNSFPLLDQRKIKSFLFHKCELEKENGHGHHFCKQPLVSCEAKIGKEPNKKGAVSVHHFMFRCIRTQFKYVVGRNDRDCNLEIQCNLRVAKSLKIKLRQKRIIEECSRLKVCLSLIYFSHLILLA